MRRPTIAQHHAEWLSLIEVSGPFLSIPVLVDVLPQGLESHDPDHARALRLHYEQWDTDHDNPAVHAAWVRSVLTDTLRLPEAALAEKQALPPSLCASVSEHGETLRPDLIVLNPSDRAN